VPSSEIVYLYCFFYLDYFGDFVVANYLVVNYLVINYFVVNYFVINYLVFGIGFSVFIIFDSLAIVLLKCTVLFVAMVPKFLIY
jgi:hypothetical protein